MFDENFWTHDYISGVNTLINALKQKTLESNHSQKFFASRIKSEREFYSLLSAAKQEKPQSGSLLSEAFESCRYSSVKQADYHLRISKELTKYCLEPLTAASHQFTQNLAEAEKILQRQYLVYSKLAGTVSKTSKSYYDLPKPHADGKTIESKTLDGAISTLRLFTDNYSATPDVQKFLKTGKINLAGISYSRKEFLDLLQSLRSNVAIISYKVALLGTYTNVSSGASIASASRRLLQNDSIAYSEKFGQSLVDAGLLKSIAQISNKFHNSHQSYYQWQPIVAKLLEDAQPQLAPPIEIERAPSPGLVEESEAYIQAVIELDLERCNLELEIFRVYEFLEKCELERIEALKLSLFTFQELVTPELELKQNMAALKTLKDELDPQRELAMFVRKHRSGPFVPNVATYESPNGVVCQSFGVDIRRTQFITPVFLAQLSSVPLTAWTSKHSLSSIYKLRSQVNTGRKFNDSIFRFFSGETIAGTLLQYYLELPDSLVPSTVYDAAKHLYAENMVELSALVRLVPPQHLEPLKLFLGYLHKEYPESSQELGVALARYLFRPTALSAINMDDTHPARFISDLLANYETVFGDAPLVIPGLPDGPRPRAESASSAFETTNGTGLIPLALSPDVDSDRLASFSPGATSGQNRPGSRLSGFLPIGDEIMAGMSSPIKVGMRPPSLPTSPAKRAFGPIRVVSPREPEQEQAKSLAAKQDQDQE